MKKIKLFVFKKLEKSVNFFYKIGISRDTPVVLGIYNFLFKNSWPYGDAIEIQGSKMVVNANEVNPVLRRTFEAYAVNLVHEKATTDLFKKTVKEGDVFLDLGANIGYFTILAARLTGSTGKIFSFEPEPKNFEYLRKNIEINNYNWAEPFLKAVSDKNGMTKLFVCSYDTGHHTINQNEGIEAYGHGRKNEKKSIEIEMVNLDIFLKGKTDRVDVVKMDVEGAEYLALMGMDNILRDNKNIKLFVEFFPLLIEKMGNSPQEFIKKLLVDYGFKIFLIPDDYAALTSEMRELKSVDDVMSYRKGEEDHINLFLKR